MKITKSLFAIAILILSASAIFAQDDFSTDKVVEKRDAPHFSSYRETVYKGDAAPVIIDSKLSRTFRTTLRETVKEEGANFAGHYTFAAWGCGTGCNQMAVVDLKTGKTYFTPGMLSVVMGVPHQLLDMLEFKANSRLLKIVGRTDGKHFGTWYYEWKNNRFRLVKAYRDMQVK
jgi:hypothetical protein